MHVKPHEVFGRSGDDLTVTVPVTITELALGADIKVPTHRGPAVTVRVKPGSANGTVIRVPGRGVRSKDGTIGDLRATLEVTVPDDSSSKAKSALEDLRIATPFDLGDLFGGGSDGLGDVLGGIFPTAPAPRQHPGTARRGRGDRDHAPFGDAIEGATVLLRLTGEGPCPVCGGTGAKSGTVPKVCPDCHGTGQQARNLGGFGLSEPCKTCRGRGLVVEDPCQACSGSGRAMSSRTIQARIPAGVADGQRIKIPGKGAPGEHGGKAGDLYVRVHVTPHGVFGRSGDNLTVTVPVTITELALGADIKVPTHRGAAVTVRVKPGTPNGKVIPRPRPGVRRKDGTLGELRATLEVTVPQDLNSKAKSALEDLRIATAGPDPREELLRRARQE